MGWLTKDPYTDKEQEENPKKPKEWPPYPTLQQLQEEPETLVLKTAPYDPRHPNTNQTRHCFHNYLDYHRCLRYVEKKGEEGETVERTCQPFKRLYKIICPNAWSDQWDEWVSENRSPFYLDPPESWDLEKRLAILRENEERAKSAKSSSIQVTISKPVEQDYDS